MQRDLTAWVAFPGNLKAVIRVASERSRCIRTGRVCAGYDKERHFVHTSSMNLRRSWRSVLDPPPQGTHRGSNRSRAPQSRRRAGDGIRILASMPCPVSSSIDMAPEYRAQLLAFFMNAYMSPSPEHSQMVKANMILELPDQLGRTCILDQAIVALCSVFVGIVRKDASLQQYGGSMYGAAMQDLRIHIQHAEQPSDSVLYAIAVLQVYELFQPSMTRLQGWGTHVRGSKALMQRCFSNVPQDTCTRRFYRHSPAILEAIINRKAASLPHPRLRNDTYCAFDDLGALLVEATALLEYSDLQKNPKLRNQETCQKLLQQCLFLRDRLQVWYAAVQDRCGQPLPWTDEDTTSSSPGSSSASFSSSPSPSSSSWSSSSSSPPPTNPMQDKNAFTFVSLSAAQIHIYFWLAMLLLHQILDDLYNLTTPVHTRILLPGQYQDQYQYQYEYPSPLSPLLAYACAHPYTSESEPDIGTDDYQDQLSPSLSQAHYYATSICRSFRYCTDPSMKVLGAYIILFPIWMAKAFFSRCQGRLGASSAAVPTSTAASVFVAAARNREMLEWCRDALGQMAELGICAAGDIWDLTWPDVVV
ncbi:hypothetical protein MPDQ_003072 [Monascus purpureus]|uniref:Transcription factor domain-containing protein n=1 Tax=Monascus purpureus TaxID=5098 RepID=A0A507R3L8_MONPU|nr:hypothetical protein MPDQ_003072 [Monascus purpureus]